MDFFRNFIFFFLEVKVMVCLCEAGYVDDLINKGPWILHCILKKVTEKVHSLYGKKIITSGFRGG